MEEAKSPPLILHYFPALARGQCIRLALHHANIPFTDDIIQPEEWYGSIKASGRFEFPCLPSLEVDGVLFSQARCILRYVGKLGGYYPLDPINALKADSFLDGLEDYFSKGFMVVVHKFLMKKENWEDIIPESVEAFKTIMKVAEERLKKQKSLYLVGNKLTIADFGFYSTLKTLPYNEKWNQYYGELDKEFPLVHKYFNKLEEVLAETWKKTDGDKYPF